MLDDDQQMNGFYEAVKDDWANVSFENPAVALVSNFQASPEGFLKAGVVGEGLERLVSLPVQIESKIRAYGIWTLSALIHLLLSAGQPLTLAHGKSTVHSYI